MALLKGVQSFTTLNNYKYRTPPECGSRASHQRYHEIVLTVSKFEPVPERRLDEIKTQPKNIHQS